MYLTHSKQSCRSLRSIVAPTVVAWLTCMCTNRDKQYDWLWSEITVAVYPLMLFLCRRRHGGVVSSEIVCNTVYWKHLVTLWYIMYASFDVAFGAAAMKTGLLKVVVRSTASTSRTVTDDIVDEITTHYRLGGVRPVKVRGGDCVAQNIFTGLLIVRRWWSVTWAVWSEVSQVDRYVLCAIGKFDQID